MSTLLTEIADGRTDLIFDYLAAGHPATSTDGHGTPLLQTCAYYGDVSAIRYLLERGETLAALGENLGLNGAVYHGHWQLCRFVLDRGADPNLPDPETGEAPLHSAVSKSSPRYLPALQVLLDYGADPNRKTIPGVETGAFMRDCRTKGETPLHRAAAFCGVKAISMLLAAGADREARDAYGDTPLSWASWYGRPGEILEPLCYGSYRVNPAYRSDVGGMATFLQGSPHPRPR
jgi:uncharacterized protein